MILVDANVLIDIVVAETVWTSWSQARIAAASVDGAVINFVIYAEIASCFSTQNDLKSFLNDFSISVLPISEDAAYLASTAHQSYRRSGGQGNVTLPDFFIGAHAVASGLKLVTRDPSRYRTYFPALELVTPG